jgi:hypothetical protein
MYGKTAHNLVNEEANLNLMNRNKTISSAVIKSIWEKDGMTL